MAPKAKPLSESVKKSLKKKAEGTRFTYGQLAKVYRRGQGAYGLWVALIVLFQVRAAQEKLMLIY